MRSLIFTIFLLTIQPSQSQPVLSFNPVITTGLNSPVDVVTANDGTNRIFIVERAGIIKVYNNTYTLLNNNFLTISTDFTSGGERGLLSLVFHPDFENNRYFFVYYTNAQGGINVDRFQTQISNPNQADNTTRTSIMTIVKPVNENNHNGGKLNFGPDGHLYFGLGDSGGGNDPRNFAQRGDSLWGKMVRINVDNFTTPPYYTIPADNPYIANPAILDEIFSFGLRNPWRWSFDRLTGNTWIADVGQAQREEVSVVTPTLANGANYGWRCYEGLNPYINTGGCQPASSYINPIFDYPHNNATGGYSITGGYVYRGTVYPAMAGYYICADYASANAWVINSTTNVSTIQSGVPGEISSFGELENGELLALTLAGSLYTVTTNSVLPLQLLSWNGNSQIGYNSLSWQTANEKQVAQFEIEYSTDGAQFTKVGTVPAKNIAQAVYTFTHNILNDNSFYRLKMIDNNGAVKYSSIISVKNSTTKNNTLIRTYNGTTNLIWLNTGNTDKVKFQLFSLTGENLLSIGNYKNNAIINLQHLPQGIYIAKISLNEKESSEKIILR
jgi:glucose/arabinose dehydrogenase